MHITYSNGKKALENIFEGHSKKVLLIEPPFYNLFGYQRWHYPLTLTLIGTKLQEEGHSVKIYDADKPTAECKSLNRTEIKNNYSLYKEALENENHPRWREIREKISEIEPEIIGLTAITAKIDSADKIARIAKEIMGKKVQVVLGGPHAQGIRYSDPDYYFGADYDAVVTHIPDIINRKPNKRLLMDYEKYSGKDLSSISTLTGCPMHCTFCCNSGENKKINLRGIEFISEELQDLKREFGTENPLYLLDDCFFSNKKRFDQLGEMFRESGYEFSAAARVMALTPEKTQDFIKRGGNHAYVGIESGSQKVLDLVKKKLTIEDILERTSWLNDFELPWNAFFIVGFPFETLDDIKKTEELAYRIKPTYISLNRFTPYPGTEIWRDYCRIEDIKFVDLFQLSPNNRIIKLTPEIEKYIEKMFQDFDAYNQKNEK